LGCSLIKSSNQISATISGFVRTFTSADLFEGKNISGKDWESGGESYLGEVNNIESEPLWKEKLANKIQVIPRKGTPMDIRS